MNARDWFGVAVRVIGLLSIGTGLYDLVMFAMLSLNILESSITADIQYARLYIGLIYFFVGLYFLRGASLVLDFAYPYQFEEAETEETLETTKETQN